MPAKGQKLIMHTLDSSRSSVTGDKGRIYVQLSLKHNGEVKENVIKGCKVS